MLPFTSLPLGSAPHVHPSTGNKFSPSHAGVLLLCVWVYALLFAMAPLAEWGSYGPEPYGTACCITWEASSQEATLYILALFIFCYLLPCLLILVSYSLILWTVQVSRRAVRQHVSPQRRAGGMHGPMVKVGCWGGSLGAAGQGGGSQSWDQTPECTPECRNQFVLSKWQQKQPCACAPHSRREQHTPHKSQSVTGSIKQQRLMLLPPSTETQTEPPEPGTLAIFPLDV